MNAYSKENKRIDHKLAKGLIQKKMQNSSYLRKILNEEGGEQILATETG